MPNNAHRGQLMNDTHKPLRYICDHAIRVAVMWIMNRITVRACQEPVDFRSENVKRILLVRALFRLGDSILSLPAVELMRSNFPEAEIDFVGPRIAKKLFENLSINRFYEIERSFPWVCSSYLVLLNRLRRRKYDLALDTSGSSAALGSFIVGFSGARFRIGMRGKWDRWCNVRLTRPTELNKYSNLPLLIKSLGLKSQKDVRAKLALTRLESAAGRERIKALTGTYEGSIVGIFVGGRKSRGKRWPAGNFIQLAMFLSAHGARPVLFVGPEEIELMAHLRCDLSQRVPVLFEPDIRKFSSLVAHCDLFVACDSGPMHLACALGVVTVAIFLKNNFDRWGPPPELARVVFSEYSVEVGNVVEACQMELSAHRSGRGVGKFVSVISSTGERHKNIASFAEYS
jgi:ADP-heptose:LPS heptosyltransferase